MINGKKLMILAIGLFIISFLGLASATLSINVNVTEKQSTIISEANSPGVYNFVINNQGNYDKAEIYSIVGISFEPKGLFELPAGKTEMEIKAYPGETTRTREGDYLFEYQIKGSGEGAFTGKIPLKIVKLKNVLGIVPKNVQYGDKSADLTISNLENVSLNDLKIRLKSEFFDTEKILSFGPYESKSLTFDINTNDIKNLEAGHYIVTSTINFENATATSENTLNYVERESIQKEKIGEGWIIRTTKMTNINKGNLEVPDKIEVTKNIFTRLFTTSSIKPLSIERSGAFVYYRWERDLKPGESWTIEVKTNYTLPFILILIIIFIAFAVYIYSRTSVVLNKRCSYVKTTGGQLALKVFINVKARKSIENVEIFDRIPHVMKLYEKAGMPHKYEEHLKKLSWKIERLTAGEERVFSYIIYSPITVVGRIELAPATGHFVKDGKSEYVYSNRTFFMSEIHPRL